jgi:predicted AAA+ superfamily ATPase
MYEGLKKPTAIKKLLQALAFQVGSEVSLQELGQTIGIDPKTVNVYIDILEKAYIIFRLTPLSACSKIISDSMMEILYSSILVKRHVFSC